MKMVELLKAACSPTAAASLKVYCIPSKLNGNYDWLGNRIVPETLMQLEEVSNKKSPYCLDESDYVTQKAYTNNKCTSPYTAVSPKAWAIDVDANGNIFERWNGGPGIMYTGQKFMFANSTPVPPAMTPVKWPAPAWLGMAWSDMYWGDLSWGVGDDFITNRWKVSRLKADDFSTNRWRALDFVTNRWKDDDFSTSRLRGSSFTVSRLKDFGWKDFAWE